MAEVGSWACVCALGRVARWRTFTRLSHPHETMTGAVGDGEKRTQDTHSEWPSSVIVYLHSPCRATKTRPSTDTVMITHVASR
jgi:phosphoketolase